MVVALVCEFSFILSTQMACACVRRLSLSAL